MQSHPALQDLHYNHKLSKNADENANLIQLFRKGKLKENGLKTFRLKYDEISTEIVNQNIFHKLHLFL